MSVSSEQNHPTNDDLFSYRLYQRALVLERARFKRFVLCGAVIQQSGSEFYHGGGSGPGTVDFRRFRDAKAKHERARRRCCRLVKIAAR